MTRRFRKQRGGIDYLQDAALVGLGAYAARNPQAPGSSIIINLAKYTLYFFAFLFGFFVIMIILVLVFAPKGNKPVSPDQKPTTSATTPPAS
jgi:cellulose synthase/poly-beta-1,6-N-acetylglucosamine synthase-like glycosyltransferase